MYTLNSSPLFWMKTRWFTSSLLNGNQGTSRFLWISELTSSLLWEKQWFFLPLVKLVVWKSVDFPPACCLDINSRNSGKTELKFIYKLNSEFFITFSRICVTFFEEIFFLFLYLMKVHSFPGILCSAVVHTVHTVPYCLWWTNLQIANSTGIVHGCHLG